jgi:hypothetical protein
MIAAPFRSHFRLIPDHAQGGVEERVVDFDVSVVLVHHHGASPAAGVPGYQEVAVSDGVFPGSE